MEYIKPVPNIITIYTKSNCPNCNEIKELTLKHNINVIYVDTDDYIKDQSERDNFKIFLEELGFEVIAFPFIYDNGPVSFRIFCDKLNAFTDL